MVSEVWRPLLGVRHRAIRLFLLAGLFALSLVAASPVPSQTIDCAGLAESEFVPSPSFDDIATVVRVFGFAAGAGPQVDSFTVNANEVRVQLLAVTGGPGLGLAYERLIPIGMLSPGQYDLYVDITTDLGTALENTVTCNPTSQEVLASTAAIPVMGWAATLAFLVTLTGAALLCLRRLY